MRVSNRPALSVHYGVSLRCLELKYESEEERLVSEVQTRPLVEQRAGFPERAVIFLANHWLLLLNLAVFVFVALPVVAPILAEAGQERPAFWIYDVYRFTCHQLPFRSFFIGGPKPDYSVSEILEATHTSHEFDLIHNPVVGSALGSQLALCHRDMAIYLAVLVAGLVFALARHRTRPLPFKIFVLFVVPIALDGFSQLLGGIVPLLPERESTWSLRTLTGAIFGVGGVWLAYPYIELGMRDLRKSLSNRS